MQQHYNPSHIIVMGGHHALLEIVLSRGLEHEISSAVDRPAWEQELYGYIRGKAFALECHPHAINGMPDHIHVVITIPPKLAVATVIGQLKGASSHRVNDIFVEHRSFAWQTEYSAFSVSERALPAIVAYVKNQKQHHTRNSFKPYMECIEVEQGTPE